MYSHGCSTYTRLPVYIVLIEHVGGFHKCSTNRDILVFTSGCLWYQHGTMLPPVPTCQLPWQPLPGCEKIVMLALCTPDCQTTWVNSKEENKPQSTSSLAQLKQYLQEVCAKQVGYILVGMDDVGGGGCGVDVRY